MISLRTKDVLHFNSNLVADFSTKQIKTLQEGLGSIREIILEDNRRTYLNIFKGFDRPMRQKMASSQFIGIFPRYIMEAVGLILIALISYILLKSNDAAFLIPKLGALAIGAQRILPAAQQIFSSWAYIASTDGDLKAVIKAINSDKKLEISNVNVSSYDFKGQIKLRDIFFRYDPTEKYILKGINLEINSGEFIGIMGETT